MDKAKAASKKKGKAPEKPTPKAAATVAAAPPAAEPQPANAPAAPKPVPGLPGVMQKAAPPVRPAAGTSGKRKPTAQDDEAGPSGTVADEPPASKRPRASQTAALASAPARDAAAPAPSSPSPSLAQAGDIPDSLTEELSENFAALRASTQPGSIR